MRAHGGLNFVRQLRDLAHKPFHEAPPLPGSGLPYMPGNPAATRVQNTQSRTD